MSKPESSAYRSLLEQSPDALFLCRDGIIHFANRAGARLFERDMAALRGCALETLVHADYRVVCDDDFAALMGEAEATPIKVQVAPGRMLDVTVAASPAPAETDGTLVRIRNISEFMRANRDVAAQIKRLNSILDTAVDAIIVTNQDGEVETFNRSAQAMFEYPAQEMIGRPISRLMNEASGRHLHSQMGKALSQKRARAGMAAQEITARRSDGTLFPAEISLSLCQLDDRRLFTAIIRDVTERRDFEDFLAHSANHDSLTGLPNRRALQDALEQATRKAAEERSRVAVWFVDLDGFKMVNDVMGHAVGDQLLVEAGRRMLAAVRPGDTVARFGGDEFSIVSPGLERASDIEPALEHYIGELSKPFAIAGREVALTANIGIALYPDHSEQVNELVTLAGAAMVFAKSEGRNLYRFFDPVMRSRSAERLSLENELRRAIERDELVLHYQPQVSLADGRISGLEALVRWNHPSRGMLPPGRFIQIAEETGLIVPLGDWVLRRACSDLRYLQDLGYRDISVAVNISAQQFADSRILETIQAAIAGSGIDPRQLDVEITESSLMDDPERVIDYLHGMKELGIRLSIDDFGTGYSSFNYLKSFPVDCLKIDRSFITEIAHSQKDQAISVTIITLAHAMGMLVLAEGVEHANQAKLLIHQGCDLLQGFLFSKPLPFETVLKRIARDDRLPIPGHNGSEAMHQPA